MATALAFCNWGAPLQNKALGSIYPLGVDGNHQHILQSTCARVSDAETTCLEEF